MQQPDIGVATASIDLTLYDRHASMILAYLSQHISNVQEAEDLLVETFLAALSRPGFAELAAEHQQAWLRRVAHNKMVDYLRKLSHLTLVSLDEALERESLELTPEEHSLRQESYTRLYRCLACLSPEQQELIQLRYGEGMRLVEIATRLHKPDATVRKRLMRALSRLRALYDQFANGREN